VTKQRMKKKRNRKKKKGKEEEKNQINKGGPKLSGAGREKKDKGKVRRIRADAKSAFKQADLQEDTKKGISQFKISQKGSGQKVGPSVSVQSTESGELIAKKKGRAKKSYHS